MKVAMKFFTPLELSKRLAAIGCTSDSNFAWFGNDAYPQYKWLRIKDEIPICPAFEFEDFVGPGERRDMNRHRVFPGADPVEVWQSMFDGDWIEALREGLSE